MHPDNGIVLFIIVGRCMFGECCTIYASMCEWLVQSVDLIADTTLGA